MEKEKILGFDVCSCNKEELLSNIFDDYENNKQSFIVNINPEIAVANHKNAEFVEILNSQKYQIPDGSGIVWASKKKKGNIRTRIAGIDFMVDLCAKAEQYNSTVFLYGAKEEIVQKAKIELQKKFKGINIIDVCNGYEDENIALKKIINLPIDILFVGLGSPKQEQFIIKNKDKLSNIKILMPVGGSFDVISNTKKRAPNWIIKCNLEWLYRLLQEPKRILRQTKLIKFIFLVLGEKHGKN